MRSQALCMLLTTALLSSCTHPGTETSASSPAQTKEGESNAGPAAESGEAKGGANQASSAESAKAKTNNTVSGAAAESLGRWQASYTTRGFVGPQVAVDKLDAQGKASPDKVANFGGCQQQKHGVSCRANEWSFVYNEAKQTAKLAGPKLTKAIVMTCTKRTDEQLGPVVVCQEAAKSKNPG